MQCIITVCCLSCSLPCRIVGALNKLKFRIKEFLIVFLVIIPSCGAFNLRGREWWKEKGVMVVVELKKTQNHHLRTDQNPLLKNQKRNQLKGGINYERNM